MTVSNSERRNEAITPWTRVVATLLLFAAFSAVVIYVLDFVSGHARPWPLSGYKTAFLAVFSVAFFPAVFYVAVFGRQPRYWLAFERHLAARNWDRSGNNSRYRFPEWGRRIGLVGLVVMTSGNAFLITLASLDRAHTWSGSFVLLIAWSLAIGAIVAVLRWWRKPMARSGVASGQGLE